MESSYLGASPVGSETTAGTARYYLAAASYGGDKAIFGFGYTTGAVNIITRFDNTGTYGKIGKALLTTKLLITEANA